MSYTPSQVCIPAPQYVPGYYSATPPAPPPKPSGPSGTSTPSRLGPPLPPTPGQYQNEPSELDGTQTYRYQQQGPTQPTIPAIEQNWLPESLKEKTTSDLHDLLQNQELLAALLDDPNTTHPAVPASQQALQPLIESNLSLANSLQDLEARLSRQREHTQSRLLALRALEQQHRSKIGETESALQSFSPMALYQRLSTSVQEQDHLVRGVEDSWLDEGGMATERETTDFVRQVREAKRMAFLRRERKERWDEGRVGGWR